MSDELRELSDSDLASHYYFNHTDLNTDENIDIRREIIRRWLYEQGINLDNGPKHYDPNSRTED